jgi:hypothetical protein
MFVCSESNSMGSRRTSVFWDVTEFRYDAVYFIYTCMQLESMVPTLPERKPRTLSLARLVVGGAGSLKIRDRFLRQTKQIFVQPWHFHEDRLLMEYVGKPPFREKDRATIGNANARYNKALVLLIVQGLRWSSAWFAANLMRTTISRRWVSV